MVTYEMIKDAQDTILSKWGEDVILACHRANPLNMSSSEFLSHCVACGGNWGGMLLSGIQKLRPEVWDTVPEDMGPFAWACICSTLILLGVDTSEK